MIIDKIVILVEIRSNFLNLRTCVICPIVPLGSLIKFDSNSELPKKKKYYLGTVNVSNISIRPGLEIMVTLKIYFLLKSKQT